jgi:hypothetical protein
LTPNLLKSEGRSSPTPAKDSGDYEEQNFQSVATIQLSKQGGTDPQQLYKREQLDGPADPQQLFLPKYKREQHADPHQLLLPPYKREQLPGPADPQQLFLPPYKREQLPGPADPSAEDDLTYERLGRQFRDLTAKVTNKK